MNEVTEETPRVDRFTIRKLLAVVWVAGAFFGSCQFSDSGDPYPLFFMGVPGAVLGYRLITWQRCRWLLTSSLLLMFAYGSFTTLIWPRIICPIDLPASARNLKVRQRFVGFTGDDLQIKFHAPVEDCRAVSPQVARMYRWELGPAITFHRSDYRLNPAASPGYFHDSRSNVPTWFNPNEIEEGEYYEGIASVWIDTKRGVFYLNCRF